MFFGGAVGRADQFIDTHHLHEQRWYCRLHVGGDFAEVHGVHDRDALQIFRQTGLGEIVGNHGLAALCLGQAGCGQRGAVGGALQLHPHGFVTHQVDGHTADHQHQDKDDKAKDDEHAAFVAVKSQGPDEETAFDPGDVIGDCLGTHNSTFPGPED